MKILLAVDGSKFTKKMLAYLATHEETLGRESEFTLLNVQPPLPPRARLALGAAVADEHHAELADKVLKPATSFLTRRRKAATPVWKVGAAGETIANYAKKGKFDLVVMGSHGWGALGSLVLGSVATQVLARCEVPVLVVR